jgi:hypothetical protein
MIPKIDAIDCISQAEPLSWEMIDEITNAE